MREHQDVPLLGAAALRAHRYIESWGVGVCEHMVPGARAFVILVNETGFVAISFIYNYINIVD